MNDQLVCIDAFVLFQESSTKESLFVCVQILLVSSSADFLALQTRNVTTQNHAKAYRLSWVGWLPHADFKGWNWEVKYR